MNEKETAKQAEAMRRLAFCSISVSTLATLTAILFIPSIYTYLQHVQSILQNEVEFCRHRTEGLYEEYEQMQGQTGFVKETKCHLKNRVNKANQLQFYSQEDVLPKQLNPLKQNLQGQKETLRRPGVEPGALAWKATSNIQRHRKREIFHRSSGVSSSNLNLEAPRARGVDNYGSVSSSGYAGINSYPTATAYGGAPESSPVYAKKPPPPHQEQCCSCGIGQAGSPGETGSPGNDGRRGLDGQPGLDGRAQSPEDMFCFDCPSGPQGLPGLL
ncbi:Col-cuticle-N domain-containing protein [Aphelenchoides bicaudatus]|nr:Col-cuticle-N domain-containing protein [Aphelenchoides bicaudatus]